MRSWTDIKNFYKIILSKYNANKRIALQPAAGRFFLRIKKARIAYDPGFLI